VVGWLVGFLTILTHYFSLFIIVMMVACEHEHVSLEEFSDGIFIVLEIKYFMNIFLSHH
jgi:hypothetical protein